MASRAGLFQPQPNSNADLQLPHFPHFPHFPHSLPRPTVLPPSSPPPQCGCSFSSQRFCFLMGLVYSLNPRPSLLSILAQFPGPLPPPLHALYQFKPDIFELIIVTPAICPLPAHTYVSLILS